MPIIDRDNSPSPAPGDNVPGSSGISSTGNQYGPYTAGSVKNLLGNRPHVSLLDIYNEKPVKHSIFPTSEDRKSTRLNSSHVSESRMPSSA